jgi:phytoene synthase
MSIASFTTSVDPAERLERSRRYCEQITRAAAKNFYYGLKLLPEPKRSAMFAVYAYMRLVDDIADEEDGRSHEQRVADLEQWRRQTQAALAGQQPAAGAASGERDAVWPAFIDVARRYALPAPIFDAVIAGQCQDLAPITFGTFEQLHDYCYQVAGVVGLASIYIWGFEGGRETEELAIARGVAFQLTNILRDLREDAARGRLYLPREDLGRFGLSEADLQTADGGGARFLDLMRFEIERAESYYAKSRELEQRIGRDSRPTLIAMTEIYHGLLKKVAAEPQRVLRERVSLSLLHKLRIGWRATRTGRGAVGVGDGTR